LCGNQNER